MKNLNQEITEKYNLLMKGQEKEIRSYNYKIWIITIILILSYLYSYNEYLPIFIVILVISFCANYYKLSWYKKWFTDWYLNAKWIGNNNDIESNEEL
jgi:hypothetical protein